MGTFRFGLVLAVVLAQGESAPAGGIGVLGDSYSDEYRFYSPHRSTARNWVEILAETRGVDFGELSPTSRGEPRNEGFAYNWARSDATTSDMLARGQHTGLAAQVARREVSFAVVFVGGNDAIHAMYAPSPSAALRGLGRRAAENVKVAVETILAASPEVKVLLATVPDIRDLPEFRDRLLAGTLDRALADSATAELDILNAEIRRTARGRRRVAVLDLARITRASNYLAPQYLLVSGHRVERARPGDAIDHMFLGDVRHLGTIGQGMFARMIVEALNSRFEAGIAPLDDREIAAFAERLNPAIATAKTDVPAMKASEVRSRGD